MSYVTAGQGWCTPFPAEGGFYVMADQGFSPLWLNKDLVLWLAKDVLHHPSLTTRNVLASSQGGMLYINQAWLAIYDQVVIT